ncbi:hypothetical protein [Bradyrhizobium retamae]|uniref:hypothetical protein n=1 Tax=Bradyrhizobium retamae TaxID=1300035 RepID=UPI0012E3F710|nr:hypothetical protein [Bradyrhizobium retamae]
MTHPVDDDPSMASAIGRCSNNWTHAETTLAWIFCHLTNTTPTVGVTVFSFFKATRTQQDVLRKLGKMTPFMTDDLNLRLKDALKTYVALAEERNELLHNPIGRRVENQVYIMLRTALPTPGELPYRTRPITPTEIDDLSTRIRTFNLELRAVEGAIRDAKFGIQITNS